jgi:hypothetical protein
MTARIPATVGRADVPRGGRTAAAEPAADGTSWTSGLTFVVSGTTSLIRRPVTTVPAAAGAGGWERCVGAFGVVAVRDGVVALAGVDDVPPLEPELEPLEPLEPPGLAVVPVVALVLVVDVDVVCVCVGLPVCVA